MSEDSHVTAPTRFAEAGGIRYAYRRFGARAGVPLVFLQHFRHGAGTEPTAGHLPKES